MSKSKRTKYGDKLMRVDGSPYWYVEGRDWENRQFRKSTKQSDWEAATQAARRIVRESSVPRVRPYALSAAFIALLKNKQLSKKSTAEIAIVQNKAARVMEHFGADFDCNQFAPDRIEGYIAARRQHQVNRRYKTQRCVKDATIGKELSKLFEALKLAARDKHYFGNIAELKEVATKVLKPSVPRTRFLSEKEFVALWNELAPVGHEHGTKAKWVAQWPASMSADEVVRRAHAVGIELTRSHVYTVRYDQRRQEKRKERKAERVRKDRRDYLLLYCSTGARRSELTRITAAQINHDLDNDGKNPRVHLLGRKGRLEHRERWVPLSPPAYAVLRARVLRTPVGPLFEPWTNLNQMLKRACERIGIPRCSTNDLRRTFITWQAKYGTDITDLKKMAGHSPTSKMIDTVYHQLNDEAGRAAADQFPAPTTMQQPLDHNVVALPVKKQPA
jgi:integrase